MNDDDRPPGGGTRVNPVIDAVIEILGWAAFGLGAGFAALALILLLVDGTWLPTRAVVETAGGGRIVRWFDDVGGVNEARLSQEQHRETGGRDMVDIFYRRGSRNRMRLTPGSPAVRAFAWLGLGLFAVGVAAIVLSWVLLFTAG